MSRLNILEGRVQYLLETSDKAREDDMFLAMILYKHFYGKHDMNTVMFDHKKQGVPSVESIGRARRKIQAKMPELRAGDKVERARYEEQKTYIEYALEG